MTEHAQMELALPILMESRPAVTSLELYQERALVAINAEESRTAWDREQNRLSRDERAAVLRRAA